MHLTASAHWPWATGSVWAVSSGRGSCQKNPSFPEWSWLFKSWLSWSKDSGFSCAFEAFSGELVFFQSPVTCRPPFVCLVCLALLSLAGTLQTAVDVVTEFLTNTPDLRRFRCVDSWWVGTWKCGRGRKDTETCLLLIISHFLGPTFMEGSESSKKKVLVLAPCMIYPLRLKS